MVAEFLTKSSHSGLTFCPCWNPVTLSWQTEASILIHSCSKGHMLTYLPSLLVKNSLIIWSSTQRIASLRVHVERAIERIKNYSITKLIAISFAPMLTKLSLCFSYTFSTTAYITMHMTSAYITLGTSFQSSTIYVIQVIHCCALTRYGSM